MMHMLHWSNYIGMVGVFLVLVAYLQLQTGRMKQNEVNFLLANIIGSVFILVSLMVHWNLASVIIEVSWLLISSYGLVKVVVVRN